MVICLEQGADLHIALPSRCHCHSLSLASVKSRLVLPFWYRLTWVVLEKRPLNGCVYVCVVDKKLNFLTEHSLASTLMIGSYERGTYTMAGL